MRLNARVDKRKRLGKLIVLVLMAMMIFYLTKNLLGLSKGGGRMEKEEKEVEELRQKNTQLNQIYSRLGTPEYEEKLIRDNLGLVKENEAVVIIPKEVSVAGEGQVVEISPHKPIWKQWLELFL